MTQPHRCTAPHPPKSVASIDGCLLLLVAYILSNHLYSQRMATLQHNLSEEEQMLHHHAATLKKLWKIIKSGNPGMRRLGRIYLKSSWYIFNCESTLVYWPSLF
jgi:hypothetical protein